MTTNLNPAMQHHLNYAAYLVRLWQDTKDGPWRASAQSVQSGEVVRFGSLTDLFAYLEANADPSQLPEIGNH